MKIRPSIQQRVHILILVNKLLGDLQNTLIGFIYRFPIISRVEVDIFGISNRSH